MENCALFLATMLHSATNTHFFHWSTDSYAKHKALAKYYDSIVDLTDTFAESYMGKYGKFTAFPSVYHQPKDPIRYMESLCYWCIFPYFFNYYHTSTTFFYCATLYHQGVDLFIVVKYTSIG